MTARANTPAVYGIPDELLVDILKKATTSTSRRELLVSKDSVNISHVSRRFRAVAIGTPRLWSVVTNKQCKEMRSMCLTRCTSSELRVFLLLVDRGTEDYTNFLADVLPFAERWREFYFRTGEDLTDYIRIIQKLSNLCRGLVLPFLSKMTLVYPNPTFYDTDGDGLDDYWQYDATAELFHFYKTWTTPSLEYLRARNLVPIRTDGTMMKECEVKLRSTSYANWHADALRSLASSWATLKKLTFSEGLQHIDGDDIPTLLLPVVEEVSLQLSLHSWHDVTRFMNALHIPKVQSLEISLPLAGFSEIIPGEHFLDDCVRAILPNHQEYRELRTFKLRIRSEGLTNFKIKNTFESSDTRNAFNTIIGRFSGLHHLVIDCPYLKPPTSLTTTMPPLRTLTLQNNDNINMDFIKLVFGGLRSGSEWAYFRHLELENCAELDEGNFEESLLGDRVRWLSKEEPVRSDSEPEYDWSEYRRTDWEDHFFVSESDESAEEGGEEDSDLDI